MQYVPIFPFFADRSSAFRVVCDTYVGVDGTGIVHNAPAFGEDDFRVCLANGIVQKVKLATTAVVVWQSFSVMDAVLG